MKIGMLAALFAFSALSTAAQAATRVSFTTGVDYSTGEYGGDDETEVIAVPFAMRVTTGPWAFGASISYLHVTGPADVADNDGEETDGGGLTARMDTEKGFGDTTVYVERTFRGVAGESTYLEFGARARLSTGDEDQGLGVGATDYTATAEFGTSSRDGGAYLSVGHRFLGDREGSDRQDGVQATVGGWLPAGDRTRIGGSVFWREASFEGNEDPASAGGYISYRWTDTLRVTWSARAGLSEASPDYSTALRFTWRPEMSSR